MSAWSLECWGKLSKKGVAKRNPRLVRGGLWGLSAMGIIGVGAIRWRIPMTLQVGILEVVVGVLFQYSMGSRV